ncbi:hypothetical protein L208DRAFT_1305747, partial [Tricholoma matsutake]
AKIAKVLTFMSDADHQSPLINIILSHYLKVPIRRTDVHITDTDGRIHTFVIYFCYNKCFGHNMAVKPFHCHIHWSGDIFVMQGGQQKDLVNLQGWYQRYIAEQAIQRYDPYFQ